MSKRHPKRKPDPVDARPALIRALAKIRPLEWATLATVIAASVSAWLAFVVGQPQNPDAFMLVLATANAVGGTIQAILLAYGRPPGTLRQRLTFTTRDGSDASEWLPLLAPPVITGLALLVLTPPGTQVEVLSSGATLYQVIPQVAFLSLVFTAVGAGVVFLLVVVPIGFLVASRLPKDERRDRPRRS